MENAEETLFLAQDEFLVYEDEHGDHHVDWGPVRDARELLGGFDERGDVCYIWKISPNKGTCLDYTEAAARFCIDYFDCDLETLDELAPHSFVKNSRAYERYASELEHRAWEDRIYGTYEEQHRLRLQDVL